jgi:hypothetical protein
MHRCNAGPSCGAKSKRTACPADHQRWVAIPARSGFENRRPQARFYTAKTHLGDDVMLHTATSAARPLRLH